MTRISLKEIDTIILGGLIELCEFRQNWTSLVAQLVKNQPTMQETGVQRPVLGRSPGEGKGYPLQYSGLENFMDSISHEVAKSRTQLSDFHFQAKMKTLSHLCVCNLAMRTKAIVN